MKIIQGGVTAPKGFMATGAHIGIKKAKKDLALIYSKSKAVAAGCFTTNTVKAAPVLWDMKINKMDKKFLGIVVTSGNANACTGEKGIEDNRTIAETFANVIGAEIEDIFVCSTGVIGVPMPIDTIIEGITKTSKSLDSSDESSFLAAEAILTTDTTIKTIAVEVQISGKPVRIAGMAKGCGMIHPNMATMLAFITTDVEISKDLLEKALQESVKDSYNMISVDGDTSTNDTILVLANGLAGNAIIEYEHEDYNIFKNALDFINIELAKALVRDGEGATKLMEVKVIRAKTKYDASLIARSVISSNLFKAALFGSDANWGRVLCAMGYSKGDFDPEDVTMNFYSFDKEVKQLLLLMELGVPIAFDEEFAKVILSRDTIYIDIFLNEGDFSATAWGCDLTYDYVKINGDYRS